ncbi:uncharacterized protein EDB91DRAFT_1083172 [Suillus paluster]|uniref:uncharacterized protein n=1 Tax=Suillus paluster TaxID=48578 RepID=UPI001B8639B2|nr:uncharacterized protein EDB91DRAFT_1083172 [Suillus paluster]KAG1737140.1 hypothetical protein EDB91DRAFT_1083172 [Suillus paluster]
MHGVPSQEWQMSFDGVSAYLKTHSTRNPRALPSTAPVPVADNGHSESELLNKMIGNRTFGFDKGPLDLFTEVKAIIASGEVPFSTPLAPINDEQELSDDNTPDFGIELPDDIHERTNIKDTVSLDNPAYPWPSKAHFVTSLLFSSPRLPFSDAQKRAVLSWVQELGARDVPSLGAIKKSHMYLDTLVGDPTEKVTARSGNVFYINDVAKLIAKDYANPLTHFAMQDYPEDSGEGMSQVFNGKKMLLDLPSPPAVRVDGMIYFTGELLQDDSGGYFIPERFFHAALPADLSDGDSDPCEQSDEKALYALGRVVERTEARFIVNEECELDCGLTPSSAKYASLSPNPLHEKSNGRMVHMVPLLIFMDNVSGNVSKQWNKHHTIYMSNANLPREMLKKEFFVNAATSGIVAWDCKYNEEVLLIPYGLFLAGDNPMQAEECSHAGLNCNYFCRTCDIGGTKEHKASGDGYSSLFMSGNLRTPENTMAEIRQQFEIALKSGASEKIKNSVSSTGVCDSASGLILNALVELGKKLRKCAASTQAMPEAEVTAVLEKEFAELLQGNKLDDTINPLLGMEGLDIHLDTPTEILHTILLGIVKYFWGQTVFLLDKAKLMGIFQIRLNSVDKDGLNAPCLNADYVCHYKGSLIGKHFKSLVQVMPFLIYDLVPLTVLNVWTVIGELVVLVWHTKIVNTEAYLAKLSRTIQDFLNVTVHNRQAPSHNTCRVFAHQDAIKHIVTGGYWYDNKASKWVRGGAQILGYLDEHPEQAQLLGLSVFNRSTPIPGSRKTQTTLGTNRKTARDNTVAWNETHCWKILKTAQPGVVYYQGKSVVAREGDVAYLNSHVIFRRATDGQLFSFTDALHASVHLPCLNLTDDEIVTTAVCTETLQQPVRQERLETSRMKPIIRHKSTPHYFINAYSIHNYNHIHLVIPETLRESPLRVTNVAEVQEMAVRQMKQKKALKKSGDTPQLDDHMEHNTQVPLVAVPTFDRAPPKSRTTVKSKAKATTSSTQRKAATSKTSQMIAGPSSQLPSVQQDSMDSLPPNTTTLLYTIHNFLHHSYMVLLPPAPYLYLGGSQQRHEVIERSYTTTAAPVLPSTPPPTMATATAPVPSSTPPLATATPTAPSSTPPPTALAAVAHCTPPSYHDCSSSAVFRQPIPQQQHAVHQMKLHSSVTIAAPLCACHQPALQQHGSLTRRSSTPPSQSQLLSGICRQPTLQQQQQQQQQQCGSPGKV